MKCCHDFRAELKSTGRVICAVRITRRLLAVILWLQVLVSLLMILRSRLGQSSELSAPEQSDHSLLKLLAEQNLCE